MDALLSLRPNPNMATIAVAILALIAFYICDQVTASINSYYFGIPMQREADRMFLQGNYRESEILYKKATRLHKATWPVAQSTSLDLCQEGIFRCQSNMR